MHRYPEQEIRRAVRLYRAGWRRDKVCAEIGCSQQILNRWLTQAGVPRVRHKQQAGVPKPRAPRTPAFKVRQAINMYQAGYSAPYIAQDIGVCKDSIYDWLRAAGVEVRSRGGDQKRPRTDSNRRLRS